MVSGKVRITLPAASAIVLKYRKKQYKNFLQFIKPDGLR